jgi:hypothetical protein
MCICLKSTRWGYANIKLESFPYQNTGSPGAVGMDGLGVTTGTDAPPADVGNCTAVLTTPGVVVVVIAPLQPQAT